MKFEFSADVKGLPAAQVKCSFECTEGELSVMLSDPVYQELGRVLATKLSQANRPNRQDNDRSRSSNRPNQDRFDHFRRYMEADVKALQNADRITNKRIDILSKRVDQIFDYVTK